MPYAMYDTCTPRHLSVGRLVSGNHNIFAEVEVQER